MASYVEKSLGDGETIIRSANIAWPYHLQSPPDRPYFTPAILQTSFHCAGVTG